MTTAWHLGALHPYETVLTLLLAFGPFVVLGVVIVVRRRQDAAEREGADPGTEVPAERVTEPPTGGSS